MPVPYNLTNVANSTDIVGFIQTVNTDVAGGGLGIIIAVTVFVIFLVAFKAFETEKAFIASVAITTILTMLLRMMGLVPDWIFIIFVLAWGLIGIFIVFNNSR